MEQEKPPAVIIFQDGSVAFVGPVTLGSLNAAMRRIQQTVDNLTIGNMQPIGEGSGTLDQSNGVE